MSDSDPLFPPRPLRWLYVDLNSYFASVEQQLDPALRGKPVIVAPVAGDTTVAIAASYEAKKFGISTGTPVWEAKRKCQELIVVAPEHKRYVAFHEAIVDEIWRHIPVTKICSIDEVACQLLNNENSVEAARALALRIKAGIQANVGECLTSSIGIAPSQLLAKLASDMQKPDGLTILPADDLPHRLFSLPLRAICGIGANMEKRLARHGVNDIEQLCARRPRDAGSAWGGVNGDRLWYALHGIDLAEKPTQKRSIGHSSVLPPNLRGSEGTWLALRRLTVKAASRLRRDGYRTRLVHIHARFDQNMGKFSAHMKVATTQDNFTILAAIDILWAKLLAAGQAEKGGFRVRMIGVSLADIESVEGEQPSLFALLDPNDPLAKETRTLMLSRAMDSINARFGRNAVSLGAAQSGRSDPVGTKIAFGRIPDLAEFHE